MGFCLDNSPRFQWIELGEVESTNNFLRGYRPLQQPDITLVTAEYQTAGRGQGKNRWEAEAGKNLLFSLLLCPTSLAASQMFVLSEVMALSIREAVEGMVGDTAAMPQPTQRKEVTVKWPNDVYVGDRKMAGILIENELKGSRLERCIIGCGVNVNQREFTFHKTQGKMHNTQGTIVPVSLAQLLEHEVERRFVLEAIMAAFTHRYEAIQRGKYAEIHADYLAVLYRREGFHTFKDEGGIFQAEIADVEPTGHLHLRDEKGLMRRYAFKEVAYI